MLLFAIQIFVLSFFVWPFYLELTVFAMSQSMDWSISSYSTCILSVISFFHLNMFMLARQFSLPVAQLLHVTYDLTCIQNIRVCIAQ